jgi:hypothetical protein
MLIFSDGMIKVTNSGEVKLYGVMTSCNAEVRQFFEELGQRNITIKYRDNRFQFSRSIDASTQQRIRNYLTNLPALRKLR